MNVMDFFLLFYKDEDALRSAFDISLEYSFNNDVARSISGEAMIFSPRKYTFSLSGVGDIGEFFDDEVELVSSYVSLHKEKLGRRRFLFEFDKFSLVDLNKKVVEGVEFKSPEELSLEYCLPVFKCYVRKKVVKKNRWNLELVEK